VRSVERLTLAHLWTGFAAFIVACILGVWQMWVRSPLTAPLSTPDHYYQSVTAHGVAMAYLLTTFFVMGFGYYVAETSLSRPLPGKAWAWTGYILGLAGALIAAIPILLNKATVLYTFYPPITGSALFYLGLVLVVIGSPWVNGSVTIQATPYHWRCSARLPMR
jgi:cytochrome c oxidase subunit 1